MPALTFTPDHTTDTLTITGHGLVTGDGPATPFTDGGTIPTGLAALTSYWAIRLDADTIQLAASSSDAMAGTPVTFSDNGSGALQLLLGPPYRVPGTAGPGGQIKSAWFNATWLALVALWNFLTGQAQSVFTGIKLAANQSIAISGTANYKHGTKQLIVPIFYGLAETAGTPGHVAGNPGAVVPQDTIVYFPIFGLAQHMRIIGFAPKLAAAPTGNITYTIMQTNGGGWVSTGVGVGPTNSSTPSVVAGSPLTLASGFAYWLAVSVPNTASATVTVDSLIVDYDVG